MIAIVTKRFLDRLRRKPYREAYVEENVRTGIAYQIRALREKRGWSQKKFAEVLGKPQSVLSRIEDPDYGKLSVQTLLEVAAALDLALLVQFSDFPEFIQRMADVSPDGLNRQSFSPRQFQPIDASPQMVAVIRKWAAEVASPNVSYARPTVNPLNALVSGAFIASNVQVLTVGGSGGANTTVDAITRHVTDLQNVAGGAPEPETLLLASQPPANAMGPAWSNPNHVGATIQ